MTQPIIGHSATQGGAGIPGSNNGGTQIPYGGGYDWPSAPTNDNGSPPYSGTGPGGLGNIPSNGAPTLQQQETTGQYGPPDVIANGVDYTQLGQQQNAANRPDTNNPFGSSTQTFDPATGQWTVNNTLSGAAAGENQEANALIPGLGKDMTTGLNTSDLTAYGTAPSYSGALASSGASDAYGLAMANLKPQQQLQTQSEQSSLEAQGLHPGDPAYDQQMNLIAQQQTSADTQAQQAADITGTQMAATQTGAEATAANTSDAQRQQQIQEQLTAAGWTTNEINQLLGGPAVSGAPGAAQPNPTAGNQAANITQATAQQQQLQNQLLNSAMSGAGSALSGLGAMAFSL